MDPYMQKNKIDTYSKYICMQIQHLRFGGREWELKNLQALSLILSCADFINCINIYVWSKVSFYIAYKSILRHTHFHPPPFRHASTDPNFLWVFIFTKLSIDLRVQASNLILSFWGTKWSLDRKSLILRWWQAGLWLWVFQSYWFWMKSRE